MGYYCGLTLQSSAMTKFGKRLLAEQNPKFHGLYVEYKGLKRLLKTKSAEAEANAARTAFSSFIPEVIAAVGDKLLEDCQKIAMVLESELRVPYTADGRAEALVELEAYVAINHQACEKILKKLFKKLEIAPCPLQTTWPSIHAALCAHRRRLEDVRQRLSPRHRAAVEGIRAAAALTPPVQPRRMSMPGLARRTEHATVVLTFRETTTSIALPDGLELRAATQATAEPAAGEEEEQQQQQQQQQQQSWAVPQAGDDEAQPRTAVPAPRLTWVRVQRITAVLVPGTLPPAADLEAADLLAAQAGIDEAAGDGAPDPYGQGSIVLPPEHPSVLLGCFAGVIATCILQGTAPGGLAWLAVLLVALYSYCALTVRQQTASFWRRLRTLATLCAVCELMVALVTGSNVVRAVLTWSRWCEMGVTTINNESLCYAVLASWASQCLIAFACAVTFALICMCGGYPYYYYCSRRRRRPERHERSPEDAMNAFHKTAMVHGAGNLWVHVVLWVAIVVLGGSVDGRGGQMHPVSFAAAVIAGAPTGDLRAIGVPYLPNVAFLGAVEAFSPPPRPAAPPHPPRPPPPPRAPPPRLPYPPLPPIPNITHFTLHTTQFTGIPDDAVD